MTMADSPCVPDITPQLEVNRPILLDDSPCVRCVGEITHSENGAGAAERAATALRTACSSAADTADAADAAAACPCPFGGLPAARMVLPAAAAAAGGAAAAAAPPALAPAVLGAGPPVVPAAPSLSICSRVRRGTCAGVMEPSRRRLAKRPLSGSWAFQGNGSVSEREHVAF